MNLRIGDKLTVYATAGDYSASLYLVIPGLQDSEADGQIAFTWPECQITGLNAHRSAETQCVVSATAAYPIEAIQDGSGEGVSFHLVVQQASRHYVQGTCDIFAKPPMIKLGSQQLYNPYDACAKQEIDRQLHDSLYQVTERWMVRIPRPGIHVFRAADAVAGGSGGVRFRVVPAGTDPSQYMRSYKNVCHVTSGRLRSPGASTCKFARAGLYVIFGEEPTDGAVASESYGGSTVVSLS